MRVIKGDATSDRGLRNVTDGAVELLKGFEFNANSVFGKTVNAQFQAAADRVTGQLSVNIESFTPAKAVTAPEGTTHFRIISAGAEIDFSNESWKIDTHGSSILPWDTTPTGAINLVHTVTPNSSNPLFTVLGIEFYQQMNGKMYSLFSGVYSAVQLVDVLPF